MPLGIYLALLALLACIAGLDLAWRRIPNHLLLLLLLLFLSGPLLGQGAWQGLSVAQRMQGLAIGLGVALLVLLIGFLLYRRRWLGGGDGKLLAVLALWTGPQALPAFLLTTGLLGGGLVLAMPLLRPVEDGLRALLWRACGPAPAPLAGLPYGVAIAAAAIVVLPGPLA